MIHSTPGVIQFQVYESVYTYFNGNIHGVSENRSLRYLDYVNDKTQDVYLEPLVKNIQQKSSTRDDQARIAISLVQHIPFDSDSDYRMSNGLFAKFRHPYESLYENKAICEDKSVLLATILKNLGFGVVLFGDTTSFHRETFFTRIC